MSEIPAHLGGFIAGGDEATQFPELWEWLYRERSIRTVLDVGAGDGQAIDFFTKLGVDAAGIDGVDTGHPKIVVHDFTDGPRISRSGLLPPGDFDLVWCCEFVEHVEERYLPNFLPSLAQGRIVLMTHAFPGQPGHHHVNCRPPDYWTGVLASIGYELDGDLTDESRYRARINPSPWNHYSRSGLAFRRNR